MEYEMGYDNGTPTQTNVSEQADEPARLRQYLQQPTKPKFEIPPIAKTAALSVALFVAFASYEKVAPMPWKISTIVGSYDAAMLELTKKVEVAEEAKLRDYVLRVELYNQVSLQQHKVVSESIGQYTTYLYDQSKIGLGHKAKLEELGQSARIGQVQAENAANMNIGSISKTFAPIIGIFSPEMGCAATEYGERLHAQSRERLEDVIAQNPSVAMSGWELGVPPPDFVKMQLQLIAPMPLPPRPEFKHITMPAEQKKEP